MNSEQVPYLFVSGDRRQPATTDPTRSAHHGQVWTTEMYRYTDGLFRRQDLGVFLNERSVTLDARTKKLTAADLERHEGELQAKLLLGVLINLVVLHQDDKQVHIDEAKVRAQTWDGRTIERDGFRVRAEVPFKGDEELFHLKPSSWRSSGYPDGSVRSGLLTIISDFNLDVTKDEITAWYDREMESVYFYLGQVNSGAEQFNAQIEASVAGRLAARKAKVGTLQSLRDQVNGTEG